MNTRVEHEVGNKRFVLYVDGKPVGLIDYAQRDGKRNLYHTEIFPEFQGAGLSKPLMKGALDQTLAEGLAVAPGCPAVAAYGTKNPEYGEQFVEWQ